MKKIPCLFVRTFLPRSGGKGFYAVLSNTVTPGLEWVSHGEGLTLRKWDGTACMVKDGLLYKRYDAKHGKTPPQGAIPCDEPDTTTGHWPHWVLVDDADPASKWHWEAWIRAKAAWEQGERLSGILPDGTYELVGPHINASEDGAALTLETFYPHDPENGGEVIPTIPEERTFDGLRHLFEVSFPHIEGLVFWKDGEPQCKIRRADFGLPWGKKTR